MTPCCKFRMPGAIASGGWPAPTRARIESVIEISASSHGTKQPTCASSTETPAERMYVDLPPMLGPVTSWGVVACA